MNYNFLPRLMMMPTVYYLDDCGGEPLADHVCDPCGTTEGGQIRSAGFVVDGTPLETPTAAAEWLAGLESKDIILIPEVIGSINGGEPILGQGYGDRTDSLVGYTYEATFRDKDYAANADFYNGIAKRRNFRFVYRTENLTHISEAGKPVSIFAKQAVTDNKDDGVVWEVTVRWRQSGLIKPFATPPDVFRCYTYTAPEA